VEVGCKHTHYFLLLGTLEKVSSVLCALPASLLFSGRIFCDQRVTWQRSLETLCIVIKFGHCKWDVALRTMVVFCALF
jgi:hypothetical protein